MIKKNIFLHFSLLAWCSVALATPPVKCQLFKACEKFEEFSYNCGEKKIASECSKFVTAFKGLLDKGSCKRSFDTKPVFDVWYCSGLKGAMNLDLHYKTLAGLKTKEAQELYASQKLRDTMDGAIAEEHKNRSIKLEKSLKKP